MQEPEKVQSDKASMEVYVVIAFALIAIVGGVIFYNQSVTPPVEPLVEKQPELPSPSTPIVAPEPVEKELVAEPPETVATVSTNDGEEAQPEVEAEVAKIELPPLPSLDDSDKLALEKASQLSWLPNYTTALISKDMLRNFVTFIDNLSKGNLATKFTPLKRPKQKFLVRESEQKLFLDETSYKRYTPYIDIINSLNIELALEHYQRLMPLIDEAYMELGYESGAFNQTLIDAIEMMLAAPVIRQPIELVAPSVMYKFKDQELEELPAAQKLMLRMGPDNTTQLRPKLQQIQITLSELAN